MRFGLPAGSYATVVVDCLLANVVVAPHSGQLDVNKFALGFCEERMRLTERILGFTLLGSEWVLWLLIGLSAAVGGDHGRARHLPVGERQVRLRGLGKELLRFLRTETPPARGARSPASARPGVAGRRRRARAGTAAAPRRCPRPWPARSRALRLDLERNLGILGTLGNNAPFIGLFGTVLGIIKAFADLSHNQGGGAAAVMSGISEALVATAVGLMVAIPAVIAFNYLPEQGAPLARARRRDGAPDSLGASGSSRRRRGDSGAGGWGVTDGRR